MSDPAERALSPWRTVATLAAAYLGLALVVVAPALLRGRLLGDPDVDVWNHAWGYWWFFDTLSRGDLPWLTRTIGAPGGGVLYYIDPLGAIAALPLVATVGPALAWNLVLVGRVAFAGLAAHALCRELSGPGRHNAVAGVAMATAPYLWVELANGISEVTAVAWVPATLWAAERARRRGGLGAWALLGACLGLSTLATFYYGMLAAIVTAALLSVPLLRGRLSLRGLALAGFVAACVGGPGLAALYRSLHDPEAMQVRGGSLNQMLLAHNAVDPRELVMPGAFHSVDFATYGEAFEHTLYLRWTVILLAAWAVWRHRRATLPWLGVAAVSAVLGLGVFLWWDGDWVRLAGGSRLWLPFGWLQRLVPSLAITHPARLGLGAVTVASVLAGWALRDVGRVGLLAIPALFLETTFLSNATWPIPDAPSEVPALYARIAASADRRGVLDLPGEVGQTMATSRYFWFQTVHGRPVPWYPDARASRNGDLDTTQRLEIPPEAKAAPPLSADVKHRLRRNYGWIVLHTDLALRAERGDLEGMLRAAFGEPTREGTALVWTMPPAVEVTVTPSRPRGQAAPPR